MVAAYNDALSNWMQRKNSKLQPVLFSELISRYPNLGWKLAPSLLKYTSAARSSYARCEALRLLTLLLRANAAQARQNTGSASAEEHRIRAQCEAEYENLRTRLRRSLEEVVQDA